MMLRKIFIYSFYSFLFIAHILLLAWILWVLKQAGQWSFQTVATHFVGLALYGSLLIIISALGIKEIQKSTWKLKHQKK